MKPYKIFSLLAVLAVLFTAASLPSVAADNAKSSTIQQRSPAVSNRLIVKLKPARASVVRSGAQIAAELKQPFSAGTMQKLQTAAGVALTESHAISNGAHVLILHGSPDKKTLSQAINNIRALSEVDYVEEDRILTTQLLPNDTSYTNLWGMQTVSAAASPSPGLTGNYGADFQTAWDSTYTGLGVVVAVIDTGVTNHAEIATNLVSTGYTFISDCRMRGTTATGGCAATTADGSATVAPTAGGSDTGDYIDTLDSTTVGSFFYGMSTSDSSWHGTHVSGTIAAIGNNNAGVIGGAYSARVLPVRVLGKGGGYTSDITDGILWAAGVHPTIANPNPAQVINMSLGGAGACSTTEQQAIDAAVAAGAVVVVAAGNSNADVADFSPASCNNVISVAAIGRDGLRAAYSNYSSPGSNTTNPVKVTIAAQGGDQSLVGFDPGILSTVDSGLTVPAGATYAYYQGTSMATPHVAAAVALMLSRKPALTPAQVKAILIGSVTTFPSSTVYASWDCATLKNCGSGILNAQYAVQNSILPYSAETALVAARGGSGGAGGCSIMPAGSTPDISLLLALLAILAYSFMLRKNPAIAKD